MSDYGKDAAGKRITSVQVQVGSSSFNGWVRTDVIFRGYQDMRLPHRVQEYVESPSFSCLGSEWTIRISYQNSNCLKFQLWPSRKEDVIAGISVINIQHWSDRGEFVADRNHIVANLVAGALWIEVRMRMARCRFIPDSSACRTLHDLLIDKESADVVFEIKGDQAVLSNDANKHEVGNFHFHAHRVILLTAASQLAELSLTD